MGGGGGYGCMASFLLFCIHYPVRTSTVVYSSSMITCIQLPDS